MTDLFAWNKAIQDMTIAELELSQETANDMNTISWMLEAAKKEGLECEVIWSFADVMKDSNNIPRACRQALSEWDI